jgi:hypothetical protein
VVKKLILYSFTTERFYFGDIYCPEFIPTLTEYRYSVGFLLLSANFVLGWGANKHVLVLVFLLATGH